MTSNIKNEEGKPNNRCVTCEFFGEICTGTNPLAMVDPEAPKPLARLGEFCRLLKERLQKKEPRWTNQYIADDSGVAKITVDRFFQGNADDIKVSTLVRIYKTLLGGLWTELPCSLDVFNARMTTVLAQLEEKDDELAKLRAENQSLQKKLTYALEDVKQYKEQAEKYWSQMETKDEQLDYRRKALNYRGRIIILLIVLCIAFCGLAIYGLMHEPLWVG